MEMTLRLLTTDEIHILDHQGCRCACWDTVKVADPFIASAYRNVTFAGDIVLHPATGTHSAGPVTFEAGISNAVIADCTVGRGTHIANIGNYIANCNIGDNAFIRDVSTIGCTPESTFGNGVEVNVMSETGGREVPVHYGLTAQEAWIIAACRHDMATVDRTKAAVAAKTASLQRGRSHIGEGAAVTGCGYICGVDIKAGARVEGASRLVNGTVGHDATVGTDVIATDFIIARSATVDSGARLDHVFVGEGSRVANGFNAHHSLIFANCLLENGEAAALFAGPCTVSIHKSTLLIGGMTSMFNAGSGVNQSNHLYKTGPCHQGVLERGVKLASDAYIMWPAHIGAFSTVMGRHKSHPDTSTLPFSYVMESDGAALVIPGVAFGNIGLVRDVDKWPRRDHRPQSPADIITFGLFNPFIACSIEEGIGLLDNLLASQPDAEILVCDGYSIRRTHALRGIKLYRMALRYYMLGALLQRIADNRSLEASDSIGTHRWIDIAGMIAPADIIADGLPTPGQWAEIYPRLEWDFIASRLACETGISLPDPDKDCIAALLDEWLSIDRTFYDMLRRDAEKEFDCDNLASTAGFGLLGPDSRKADFTSVRGTLDAHSVSHLLTARTALAEAIASAITRRLNNN